MAEVLPLLGVGSSHSIEIVEAPHVTSVLPASGEDMDGNRYVVKW